jgi:hypothetical protein
MYFYKNNDTHLKKKLSCNLSLDEKEEIEDSSSSKKSQKETLGKLKASQIVKKKGFQFDSDSDDDSEDESEENYASEVEEVDENSDSSSTKMDDDGSSISPLKKDLKIDKTELLLRPIREYSLKRLYDADPELFKYETNKSYQAYSTICGEVDFRQPIVISKRHKEMIDREHPNSYNEHLEYGSKTRKNIYICPKYWCVNCETSLTEEELYNVKGVNSSIIEKVTKRDTIYITKNDKEMVNLLSGEGKNIFDSNVVLYVNDKKIPNAKIVIMPQKIQFNWKDGSNKIKKDIKID